MKSQAEKLASEHCRRILEALESGPKSIDELVKLTKLTRGSVEKHTDVLLAADLVMRNPQGQISASS